LPEKNTTQTAMAMSSIAKKMTGMALRFIISPASAA